LSTPIHGTVTPGFEPVRDLFADNFSRDDDYRELGAALAVVHHGRTVVDLWAGSMDATGDRPWGRDTLVNVFSASKGVAALAVALLVDRGAIEYDDPVALHWPEFAAHGKGGVTIAEALSHQAGLPGFMEPTSLEDLYDWDRMVERIAAQPPVWPPGTATSYHAITHGYIAGEIVRRVTGRTLGRFVAEHIAGPLGLDLVIGAGPDLDPRIADLQQPRRPKSVAGLNLSPHGVMALSNPVLRPKVANTRPFRAAEIPAVNAHASALALGRLYGALAARGRLDGVQLLSADALAQFTAVRSDRPDGMLGDGVRWAAGVILNDRRFFGPNRDAFGHSGWGGSFGCADPVAGLGIGYVCNQMGADLVGDPRAVALCHAIAACAG